VYDFVFDTPASARPGTFKFRFWIDDTTPPTITLLTRTVTAGKPIRLAVRDLGAGVDRGSMSVSLGGDPAHFSYAHGTLSIRTSKALAGRRVSIVVSAADYQELKNMEDVGPVLPNTRILHAFVTSRS